MAYTDILYETHGHTGLITLNRPERLNAWGGSMDRDVRDAFREAEADPHVVAIVITGAGRGFCSGADMGSLNQIAAAGGETVVKDPRETEASIEANYYQRFSFPLRVQKPLIAAINGPAAGLGFILPLYCDIRFASDQARFGTAFAKLALIAEHGVSWLLPRAVGMGNAFDLLYSARIIDAHEALRMGYLQRVIPHDELIPQTLAYVESFAKSSSPEAMRVSRKLVWDGMFQDLARATQSANAAMPATLAHDDFKEGLQAFGEKRPPVYRGLSVQSRV